ncbi:hypothetical protein GOD35_29125 [Sinorhizobium medicae]|nr:hypothetical protein [Sinorhizobium medicae]MDX0696780.1 hypothetical protein [Sinorhizobium medicae]RVO72479.1 hypothetical protein CN084_28080 [Sinorhizobium medicae]
MSADRHDEASVLFAGMAGFKAAAGEISPADPVRFLNEVFTASDHLLERHGLEKIKTPREQLYGGQRGACCKAGSRRSTSAAGYRHARESQANLRSNRMGPDSAASDCIGRIVAAASVARRSTLLRTLASTSTAAFMRGGLAN